MCRELTEQQGASNCETALMTVDQWRRRASSDIGIGIGAGANVLVVCRWRDQLHRPVAIQIAAQHYHWRGRRCGKMSWHPISGFV